MTTPLATSVGSAWRIRVVVAAALDGARSQPRHVVLAGLVAGLLLGQQSTTAVLLAAMLSVPIAGRPVLALAASLAVLAGAGLAGARAAALDAGRLAALRGHELHAHALLLEPLRSRAHDFSVARVRLTDGVAAGEQAVVRVHAPRAGGAAPVVGDELAVSGRVAPLGHWDEYQRRRGAHAALETERLVATGRHRGGLAGRLDAARQRSEKALARGLAPPEAALLRGMILGEDERLAPGVRDDFQRSGLAHVLAVSGQNVMLLATLVLAAGAATGLPLRMRLGVALALVALYVPLSGGGPSIQRAGVMGGAGLVAVLAGRPASRWYSVGLAAAVTLAINPRTSGEPGWQLSFAAVVALLLLGPPLRIALQRRLPNVLADATAITLAATLGTAPLMALHFDRVSLAALPANVLAAPAIAPIMWLGMLAAGAGQLGTAAATPFTALAAPLLVTLELLARTAARFPLASIPVRIASPSALLVVYAALAAAALGLLRALGPHSLSRRPSGRWQTAGAAALAVVVALALRAAHPGPRPPDPRELVVSFLDVGQGDATLLQRDGAAILVDTGPPDGPVLRRLAAAGVRRLDALVLTHAQADHEGAASAVIRAYRPRLVLDGGDGWHSRVQAALPALLRTGGGRLVDPVAGDVVRAGSMRLRILWPASPSPGWKPVGDPNERAVVALLTCRGFRLLLTADAESDVTSRLALPAVDVLKVAHHGSADPGLPALLRRLRPRIAAIEVGRHNTYGHPAPATLAALRVVPRVFRTDRDGTIRLLVRGSRMEVERA